MPLLPLALLAAAIAQEAPTDPRAEAPASFDRVPTQDDGDPFATLTLGLALESLSPAAEAWAISTGGDLEEVDSQRLSALALHVGALHFHGQVELYAGFPLYAIPARAGDRQIDAAWLTATGARFYPLALEPGSARPHVSTELAIRRVCLDAAADPTMDFGCQSAFGAPVGAGLGVRSRNGLVVDLNASYQIVGPFETYADLEAQALGNAAPGDEPGFINLTGGQLALAVKWNPDLTPNLVAPGFEIDADARYRALRERGAASGIALAVGPSWRILQDTGSEYFVEHRPYLADAYGERPFAHGSLGWYFDRGDSELRLAGRRIVGGADAWGASLETRRIGGFVEALKMIPLDRYGFVPFLGVGLGGEWIAIADTARDQPRSLERWALAPSLIFGWDIRPDPAAAWLLRTGLRWIPAETVQIEGIDYGLGGLEYDLIQLRVMPGRLLGAR